MQEALIYGVIAASSLIIGAAIALPLNNLPDDMQTTVEKVNRTIMAFGAGVLICTVAFNLMGDAFAKGGYDHLVLGAVTGALAFIAGDLLIGRRGSGWELLLGALLDGIPESVVIGIGLVAGKGLGLIMLIAVFISNLPESFSGARIMLCTPLRDGRPYGVRGTLGAWGLVSGVCLGSTVVGYRILGDLSPSWVAFVLAFAGGAILAMVAHTMIPAAFGKIEQVGATADGAPESAGLVILDKVEAMATVAGFLLAFILSTLTR